MLNKFVHGDTIGSMAEPLILVVDDEVNNLTVLESRLIRRNYSVVAASSGAEAIEKVKQKSPDLVLLDVMMPEMDGFETCKRIKEITKDVFMPVILLTAKDDKESRIKGLDIGADDYITKPFDMDELMARIRAMLRIKDLKQQIEKKDREIKRLGEELKEKHRYQNMTGSSKVMRQVFEKMKLAANVTSPVIITGESGTGKEMVAKGIHYSSSVVNAPFIAVNCAALPMELIESELFGHKKGAFSGAHTASAGLFRAADGGTIFLDEITEMSRDMQAKFLRVLQENTVRMVGGTEETPINVRVITATNIPVEQAVKDGKFREDLYYRISVLPIHLPPLRERKDDIPQLARTFVALFNKRFGRSIKGFSDGALKALNAHHWPGNVRELQNVVERCFAMPDIDVIEEKHVQVQSALGSSDAPRTPSAVAGGDAGEEEGEILPLDETEKRLIISALKKTGHNKLKAAKLLGIHRSRLYKKLERYGITA